MTSNEDTFFTYPTQHGPITLRASSRGICEVAFNADDMGVRRVATALTNQAANELQEYLAGKRTSFDVALDLRGSAFQKAVWTEVCSIQYGETRTATEIATAMGKPGSHRSVGTAIRANLLAPFVPTHRVVMPNATDRKAKIFRALVSLEKRTLS